MDTAKGMIILVLVITGIIFLMVMVIDYLYRLVRGNTRTLSDGFLFTYNGRKPLHVNNLTDARILAMEFNKQGIVYTVYPMRNGLVGIPFHSDLLL